MSHFFGFKNHPLFLYQFNFSLPQTHSKKKLKIEKVGPLPKFSTKFSHSIEKFAFLPPPCSFNEQQNKKSPKLFLFLFFPIVFSSFLLLEENSPKKKGLKHLKKDQKCLEDSGKKEKDLKHLKKE